MVSSEADRWWNREDWWTVWLGAVIIAGGRAWPGEYYPQTAEMVWKYRDALPGS